MVKARGRMPPAPRPWSTRKAMSCPMLCACPHSSEPVRNRPMATAYTGRRPSWSDSLPKMGTVVVEASRYPEKTQA